MPSAPLQAPAGERPLNHQEAESLSHFRSEYRRLQSEAMTGRGNPEAFLTQSFTQAYRPTPTGMAPHQPALEPGPGGRAFLPHGAYPPGVSVVIISQPGLGYGHAGPTGEHVRRAFREQASAGPSSGGAAPTHLLYNPSQDRVFILEGNLGADGRPQYHEGRQPGEVLQQPLPVPVVPRSAPRRPVASASRPPEPSPVAHLPAAAPDIDFNEYIQWPESPSSSRPVTRPTPQAGDPGVRTPHNPFQAGSP